MQDISNMTREELEAHAKELEEQVENEPQNMTRRSVMKKVGGAAIGVGAVGVYATKAASAAPSGTFPAETDDPLLKTRVDRVRYIARSTTPPTPSSGRILSYVDGGDLP